MLQSSKPGTPVILDGELIGSNKATQIRMRLLSPLQNDLDIVTCITPHGSIIRVGRSNVSEITVDSELEILHSLEEQAEKMGYKPYNGFLSNQGTIG